MATITVTSTLPSLISAFNPQLITFTITAGVVPKVTIIGIDFLCVKTSTSGGLDYYTFDLTDKLPTLLGFPPSNYTNGGGYSKSLSLAISGIGATTVTLTSKICFGIDEIGTNLELLEVSTLGRRQSCYHNGRIGLYIATGGSYVLNVGLATETKTLTTGYNIIETSLPNGLLEIAGTDIEFAHKLIAPISGTTNKIVKWIDKDGNYAEWDFRLLSTKKPIKNSNKISSEPSQLVDKYFISRNISKEKKIEFMFDTVAIDTDHYRQLAYIAESPIVWYNNRVVEVKDSNDSVAECRQNLKFSLTLEAEEYAASY